MPPLLQAMQTEGSLSGEKLDGDPMALWAQNEALPLESSSVVRDRRGLRGGGDSTAEECREMRLMTLLRALWYQDESALKALRRHWPDFRFAAEAVGRRVCAARTGCLRTAIGVRDAARYAGPCAQGGKGWEFCT